LNVIVLSHRRTEAKPHPSPPDSYTPAISVQMCERAQYWRVCLERFEQALVGDPGLFSGCHDFTGHPLSQTSREAILDYLNAPAPAAWLKLRHTLVCGTTTLWLAYMQSRQGGCNDAPTPEQLRLAIRMAVEAGHRMALEQVAEHADCESCDSEKERNRVA